MADPERIIVSVLRNAVLESKKTNPLVEGVILCGSRSQEKDGMTMARPDSDVDLIHVIRTSITRPSYVLFDCIDRELQPLGLQQHRLSTLWVDVINPALEGDQHALAICGYAFKYLDRNSIFIIDDYEISESIQRLSNCQQKDWTRISFHRSPVPVTL